MFVFKSAFRNSTSQCHRVPSLTTPCHSSFLPYSTGLQIHGFKLRKFNAPIPTCSMMRHYSTKPDKFPRITGLRCRVFPFSKAPLFNGLISNSLIKPFLDHSFSTTEFLYNSQKMVERVSSRIAEGDFEGLQGLVTPDILKEIETNLPKFSADQRRDLAVDIDELSFSYVDKIILRVAKDHLSVRLEILTIHYAVKGVQEDVKKMVEGYGSRNKEAAMNIMRAIRSRPYVLNYRFFRHFDLLSREGGDWQINGIQHVSYNSVAPLLKSRNR